MKSLIILGSILAVISCGRGVTQPCNTDAGHLDSGIDSGVVVVDAGAADSGIVDSGTRDAGHLIGQSLVWVWFAYDRALPQLQTNPQSFTHVSPAFYQTNYYYDGGVPQFWNTTTDNFSGMTSLQFTQQVHAMGLKVTPLVFAGGANQGTDQGFINIITDTPSGTKQSFINSLVSEGLAKGYDGWNLDWEPSAAGQNYALYGVDYQNTLAAIHSALNANGMTLSVDLGTWFVKQTWCSGGTGIADLPALSTVADMFILEDYNSTLGTSTNSCPGSLPNPQNCGTDFISALNLMCVYLPNSVVSISLNANSTQSNPIAGVAVSTLKSYGIKNMAIWPDWNVAGPGTTYLFLYSGGMVPSGDTWFAESQNFLQFWTR